MTGRRRQGSTSSVESIDDSRIHWRKESSVLLAASNEASKNDWPAFELRDAVVLNKDGMTMENALEVGTKGPYIVRGNLIIDEPEQRQHLLMRVKSSIPIEIGQCINYSVGESEDGAPIIWVSGAGGWYELNPSRAYRHIYAKMREATQLYYRIIDVYQDTPQKKHKKSKHAVAVAELYPIFLQYAIRIGDGATIEDVLQRCEDHARFFIWQFAQEDVETFDWKPTPFYKWFITEYKDLYEKSHELMKAPRKLPRLSVSRSPAPAHSSIPLRSRGSSSLEPKDGIDMRTTDEATSTRFHTKKTRSRSATSNSEAKREDVDVPMPTVGEETVAGVDDGYSGLTDPAFQSMLEAFQTVCEQLKDSRNGMSVSGTLNKLYFSYRFPTYKDGTVGSHRIPVKEVLHYYVKDLLRSIDTSELEGHEVLGYLQGLAKTKFVPIALKPSQFPFVVVPRKPMSKPRHSEPAPLDSGASGQESHDGTAWARSASQVTRGGKQLGRRGGKKSTLRLPSSSNKRTHADLESDSDAGEFGGAKKSHYFSDGRDADDSMEDDAAEASSPDVEDGDTAAEEEPVGFVIRSEKIPSEVPRGPQDTWTCDQDGCDAVVRGGDDDDRKERIREHFREHEAQVERVNLAVAESRGHMPINHLLEKIKQLGEKTQQEEQLSIDGVPLPQPIKRKLLV